MKSSTSSSILLLRWWFLATASSISMLVVPSLGQSSSSSSSSSSCPGFRLGTTSCTGIFSDSTLVASCPNDDDSDVVAVSGTFTATSAFDESARVTFVPCLKVLGFCFESYAQDGGSLCDLVTNDDGDDDCGSASTYSIDETFDVPKEAKDYSWAMGLVTIKVLVDHEEACSQDAYEDYNSSTTSAFMATGISMASLFAVGGLGLYFVRRRRKPLLVLEGGGLFGEGNEHGFVTMMDLTPSVSSIGIKGAFTVEGFV